VNTSICKGCGAEIVWCLNPATGKKIPMDVKPTVYHVIDCGQGRVEAIKAEDQELLGVSHFATCPKADQFSKGQQ
jgi:hypothetical protein